MKLPSPILAVLVATLVPVAAHAQLLPTTQQLNKVDVRVNVKTEGKAFDGKGAGEQQKRSLEITLTNKTREDLSGLKVKWVMFSTDLKSDKVGKAGSGEVNSNISAGRSEVLEGKTVTMNYTQKHTVRDNAGQNNNRNNNNRNNNNRVKTIPASGDRYRGWGVQVYEGGTLVGDAYSTQDLKSGM